MRRQASNVHSGLMHPLAISGAQKQLSPRARVGKVRRLAIKTRHLSAELKRALEGLSRRRVLTDVKELPVNSEIEKPPWPEGADRSELFEQLIESATGFAIFTTDADGLVTSWNVGGERLIGYCESEILGKTADIIFAPEDRSRGIPERERAQTLRKGRAEDERWHMRKDGSAFWGSGLMMPLRGGGGFVKILRDRTEQHLAQERLAASEERFRTLASSIPQLVFRTRSSGARSWGSPQWEVYAGLSDAQSREFGWLDAVHPDDRAATIEAWTQARRTGVYSVEHRIRRHADGAYRWHQTRAVPAAVDSSGREEEWVGTSTDIDELRGLQSRQQVLLAELQHRTRNLLALVQAMARRTLRRASSFEEFIAVWQRYRALRPLLPVQEKARLHCAG
jgi:PAS domain S-box-containing protein